MNRLYCMPFIIAVFIFAGCSRKSAPLASSMQTEGLHHKWKVSKVADGLLTNNIYIDLRDVYHSGASAGCRYFSFTPKFGHNNRMEIANVSAHLSGCADERTDQVLRSSLGEVYSFSLVNNQLQLLAKDGRLMFAAEKATDDENGSIRRKWSIEQMINANSDQLVKVTSFLDLTEPAKGQAGVGCNRFSFSVVADNTYHITIGNVASTEMFCKDAAANESVLFKLLPLVNKYQVTGDRLKLFDKDNVLLVEGKSELK
ncbi:META domain-containing protein [Niabella hibiscisoli]|uniref:META domain-containing protein n=1 Tax=Niabella hibiscisoli TaxID=1825928 RepID=UPI001F107828|nr:META domain-containing protein [Niabella hibiscisoli]MCH5714886.1 META domain-containing protein [Niabella hibiscisoli]